MFLNFPKTPSLRTDNLFLLRSLKYKLESMNNKMILTIEKWVKDHHSMVTTQWLAPFCQERIPKIKQKQEFCVTASLRNSGDTKQMYIDAINPLDRGLLDTSQI